MNETKSTIITVVAVDTGKSDGDTGDIVVLSEVHRPPRKCIASLGARMCVHVTVNSEACRHACSDFNCVLVGRQTVCNTCIHNQLNFVHTANCKVGLDEQT